MIESFDFTASLGRLSIAGKGQSKLRPLTGGDAIITSVRATIATLQYSKARSVEIVAEAASSVRRLYATRSMLPHALFKVGKTENGGSR